LFVMLFAGTTSPIICCTSANEVKDAITLFCRKNDTVLELGAELADVSSHLCRTIGEHGKAVLVDKKRRDSNTGRCKFRNVETFVSSSLDQPQKTTETVENEEMKSSFVDRVNLIYLDDLSDWKKKIFHEPNACSQYDIIIMSISHIIGHDLYMTILSFANEMFNAIPVKSHPRAMIIKSKTLYSLSKRLVHSQRLFDGTTKIPDDIKRSSEPYIIAGVKVDEYRKTIPFTVREDDAILEVGCHFGRTTKLLDDAGRHCIGVDIGPKIIKNARKQYPNIQFAVGDAWKTLQLIKLRKNLAMEDELGYDIVYADIGGLSGADGHLESLSLLDSIGHALEPRCIIIKSVCMRSLASRLKFFPKEWNKFQAGQGKKESSFKGEEPKTKRVKI